MGSWCCEGDAMTALISSGAGRPSPAASAPATTPSCSAQETGGVKRCPVVSTSGKGQHILWGIPLHSRLTGLPAEHTRK